MPCLLPTLLRATRAALQSPPRVVAASVSQRLLSTPAQPAASRSSMDSAEELLAPLRLAVRQQVPILARIRARHPFPVHARDRDPWASCPLCIPRIQPWASPASLSTPVSRFSSKLMLRASFL